LKALVFHTIGEYPNYEDLSIDQPTNTVEINMKYGALNHRDVWIMKGLYPGIRSNVIMGADGLGTIGAKRVIIYPGLHWGNQDFQGAKFEVLGIPNHGVFAESFYGKIENIFDAPDHLNDAQAAALPLAGLTAYRALFSRAQLKSSDKVFVNGVGGGVALFAVQFALALGCEVVVSSGDDEKIKKAIALGCKDGLNYNDVGWQKKCKSIHGGFDVIVDSNGGCDMNDLIRMANYGARVVFYGASQGNFNHLNPQTIFWKQISLLGTTMGSPIEFKAMLDFVEKHQIIPQVDKIYELNNYIEAFKSMQSKKQFGKILLKIQ
jgi:zinc-binding alcohol dehydrogenase/oxidoreductase